ncbi:receptor-like protein 6 [Gossypium arboreum]|uniref:receptor-like protein 6 n=1 Tax=Gossypium arboreum TaxID=29729 RepID=UPI000819638E|nr:receptor-like protein 6 [Gossypium arboreum]
MFDVVPTSFKNLPSSLKRYLPKSNWSSTLKYFKLYNNHFGGSIPASTGNLTKITFLDLSLNEFKGQLPSTLFGLKQVTHLGLSCNRLEGPLLTHVTGLQNLDELFLNDNLLTGGIPSWPFTLPSLKYLDLSNNSLTGPIDKIQKPNSVQEVYLAYNHMHGEIPSSFFNLANLIELDLLSNNFSGVIKSDMLLKLKNLETLVLSSNNFSGAIKLDVLSKLKNLTMLELSNNKLLSFSSDDGVNSTFQKLETLYFSSCNVQQFSNILRSAKSLRYLDLSNNAIKGSIFKWESEGWEQLFYLNLSHNLLMSLEQFPGENLHILDLRSNLLQGPLLVPLPPSLEEFWISNNNLTGEIPHSICNLTFPQILDLSRNYIGGIIPKCLGSSSYGPRIINLQKNNFKGKIPDFCADYNGLINLALNDNQLEGPLPRSLINCFMQLFLDIWYPSYLRPMFKLMMASNWNGVNLSQPLVPIFQGSNYGVWSTKMKTLFLSQDLLDLVENRYGEEEVAA